MAPSAPVNGPNWVGTFTRFEDAVNVDYDGNGVTIAADDAFLRIVIIGHCS